MQAHARTRTRARSMQGCVHLPLTRTACARPLYRNPLEPLLKKLSEEFTDDQDLSVRLSRLFKARNFVHMRDSIGGTGRRKGMVLVKIFKTIVFVDGPPPT